MEFTKAENKELTEAERKSFGEKLYALRKKNGLSQQAVAEALQVSRQAISRWEVGTSVPTIENLSLLSKLYGVSTDYLINTESEHPVRIKKEVAVGDKMNRKDRAVRFVCVFIAVVIIIAVIGVILTPRDVEVLDFNAIGQESWNGLSTDEIPIEW